jgi:integrase
VKYRKPYTLYRRGEKWYFRLGTDPKRRPHTTGQTERVEAIRYVEQIVEACGPAPLFKTFAANMFDWEKSEYLKRRQQRKGKQISKPVASLRHGHVQNYLIQRWGEYHLDKIQLVDYEDWLYGLKLANQTKCHILHTTSLILREARRLGRIRHNPLEGIEPPSPNNQARDYLRKEELEKLFPRDMEQFKKVWWIPRYGVMFALAASGGLRSGELRALRWKHIAWERSGVAVIVAIKKNGTEGTPKNGKGRPVLLSERMMGLLGWWKDQCPGAGLEDLVFPERDGRTLVWAFRKGMRRAGIEYKDRYLDVHSLRHTYNTHMRDLLKDEQLMAFTGHQSLRMVENYDHREIAGRLERLAPLQGQINKFPL